MISDALSVANATINTTNLPQSKPHNTVSNEEPEVSPVLKKSTGVGLERMESLTALAFDPKKSKPGPKRNSLLIKQGFTNIGTTSSAADLKRQSAADKAKTQKQEKLRKERNNIFAEMNMNRRGVAVENKKE